MIPVQSVRASAYTIPTDAPEGDGTYRWDSTTIVIAEVSAGGIRAWATRTQTGPPRNS